MRLHHVQLAIPRGGEADARSFYADGLGLIEVDKPADLAARGGCWFRAYADGQVADGQVTAEIHLGVEEPFAPARKAHPALVLGSVAELDALAARLTGRGVEVVHRERESFPGHLRFHCSDPFGNRVEVLAPLGAEAQSPQAHSAEPLVAAPSTTEPQADESPAAGSDADSQAVDPLLAHPSVRAVLAALHERGWHGEVRVFGEGVRTAAAAAAALGCETGAIANSLLFDAAGTPVLILTSGAHRVDVVKVSAEQGLPSLARATPEFVRAATGQVIGGVAPVGHPAPIASYLDRALADYPTIWAAAGHSHTVFSTTYAELARLTGADEIDVA